MLRPRFVRPTLSTLLGQLLPLHLSRPELQLFIASELKNFVIPARKEQTDWSFRFRFSLHCWQFVFRVGKCTSGWSQEENAADTSFAARLPALCSRLHRSFTRERDHQLHQLHVNLYQFYYFIWLLLVTKKQSISNRSLWPFFSAPFLSFVYPWVFSAGFLYRGYSATCRAPGSTSSLMTPQNLLIFLTQDAWFGRKKLFKRKTSFCFYKEICYLLLHE